MNIQDLLTPTALIGAALFGLISSFLAFKKKKNPYLWFLIGSFFGILGLFAIFLLPQTSKSQKKSPTTDIKSPQNLMPGPVDKVWFYLDPTHKQIGPISYQAINKALDIGEISPTTYVWHENLSSWKKIEELRTVDTKR